MDTYTKDQTALDQTALTEELWQAWVQKGKLRDEATALKWKVVAAIAICLFASATAVYFVLAK